MDTEKRRQLGNNPQNVTGHSAVIGAPLNVPKGLHHLATGTVPTGGNQTMGSSAANKTAGGGTGQLRRGNLSRYLLEKTQTNDSGLDLSPGTLQTLIHPLRSSNSSTGSTSSLPGRALFESPASDVDHNDSHHQESEDSKSDSFYLPPPVNPAVSRSVLSEHSQNSTVIEKTLTDDSHSHSRNVSKSGHVDEMIEKPIRKETTNPAKPKLLDHQQSSFPHSNKHDITPNNNGFQVPYDVHQARSIKQTNNSISNVENTEPGELESVSSRKSSGGTNAGSQANQQLHNMNNSNGFRSHSDIAAVIPPSVANTRAAIQTPKPKSCRKKPPVPSSSKKQTGWKFLSEHVQGREFLILEQLGKGGCGEVSLVMEKDTRKQFALKIVQLHGIDEALVQECINEVEMLIDLKGTELVVDIQSWEFNRTEKTMKILMEKGQCDLNYTIHKAIKMEKPIKLIKMKYIFESLLTIVDKIHSTGIVHADLKPANFVWVDDNLKIIDFGIASRLQNDHTSIAMPNPKGTLNFISPEIIKLDDCGRSRLSPKSDIWALGCILYLMVYGRTPFEHISHPVTKMNAILQGDIIYHQLPPHLQGSDVISLLKLCFQIDYKRRPSAAELLRHAFLKP